MQESDRRGQSRVACHLEVFSKDNTRYDLLDFNVEGMRLRGPHFFGKLQLTLALGGQRLEFTATVVRQIAVPGGFDLGVIVFGDDATMSRLGFLAAALGHQAPESICFKPYALILGANEAAKTSKAIAAAPLPPLTLEAMAASAAVHQRDAFVWKWGRDAIAACTLSCVPAAKREQAVDLKLTWAVLTTMIDDAVDLLKDRAVFDDLRKHALAFSSRDTAPPRYAAATRAWRTLRAMLADLPSHRAIDPWFTFDHETVAHAMGYALLVNVHPLAINRSEMHTWNVHSFYMHPFADIDLMFAQNLDVEEVGQVREIIDHAQHMCAIANWLGTWEREFRQRDLTSGVVSTAIERQVFTIDELDEPTGAIALVKRAHVEEYWMAQWERHWHAVQALPDVVAFDKHAYLAGLERVFQLQMLGRGKL